MACASCNNNYTRPNPCNPCDKGHDTCDDAVQIAYVPGTACTIGITYNCITSTLSLKEGIQNCETDTRMVWNADTGCINYYSERYTNNMETGVPNIICASEIASAINLCDLNDVSDNACDPDQCALLVYQKTANCGANCKGVNDMWVPWTVADHKSDYLTYVMGFNDEGCPIVLDAPGDKSKYWWAMWRGDSKFGYTQPNKVDNLPTDSNGDPLVISQNADGSPIVAPVKLGDIFKPSECTYFDPANGYAIANPGGNEICYYEFQGRMNISLDMVVTSAREQKVYFNEHIATIHDTRFFPKIGDGEYIDLPVHAVWQNNSDGKIMPIWLRIDNQGRLLLSGEETARTTSGKANYIALGIDDAVDWKWRG